MLYPIWLFYKKCIILKIFAKLVYLFNFIKLIRIFFGVGFIEYSIMSPAMRKKCRLIVVIADTKWLVNMQKGYRITIHLP